MVKRLLCLLIALLLAVGIAGCGLLELPAGWEGDFSYDISESFQESISQPEYEPSKPSDVSQPNAPPENPSLDKNDSYTTKEDVALYLHLYGVLPSNFITKKEAQALGWTGGSVENYAPGKCIGGDRFGNYEGLLPEKNGRNYKECDIDTLGKKSRGAKRIVYSNDGLIYYTDDHYESFTLLYGKE